MASFAKNKILRHYIDHNHHVNNARYFDLAEEYLPEEFSISAARIEYKTPAKANDIVIPVKYDLNSECILISLQGTEGQIFANVEFHKKQ